MMIGWTLEGTLVVVVIEIFLDADVSLVDPHCFWYLLEEPFHIDVDEYSYSYYYYTVVVRVKKVAYWWWWWMVQESS